MGRRLYSLLVVVLFLLSPFAQALGSGDIDGMSDPEAEVGDVVPDRRTADADEALSGVGGHFTENIGQLGEGAGAFYCVGDPLSVALGDGWAAYELVDEEKGRAVLFRTEFQGANQVRPVGAGPVTHESNFFIGPDQDGWRTGARNYREVVYHGIYDGVDLAFSIRDRMLKYEFRLEPGTSPDGIAIAYEGVEGLTIDGATGDLVITTEVGEVREDAPVSCQPGPAGRDPVRSAFHMLDGTTIAFDVGDHDEARPLVIDPGMEFSTYIGGGQNDVCGCGVVDIEGYTYITGATYSGNFPVTAGAYDTTISAFMDAIAVKVKKDGTGLEWATFVGAIGHDVSLSCDVDNIGNVLIGGWTWISVGFPITPGVVQTSLNGGREGWTALVRADGKALKFSTYVGGSGDDMVFGLSLGKNGTVYITGQTASTSMPGATGSYCSTAPGGLDAFVMVLNANATKYIYASYLGGPGDDWAKRIDTDSKGCAVICGEAESGFPTTSNAFCQTHKGGIDGFIAKFNANGTDLEFSTLLGGAKDDWVKVVAVHRSGDVFGTGSTSSVDFPTTSNAFDTTFGGNRDAFAVRLNASGDKLVYSSFLGSKEYDDGFGLDVDFNGTAFVGVDTGSDDLVTTTDAYDRSFNAGDYDVYIARLNATGEKLEYGSYLGGTGLDVHFAIMRGTNFTTITGNTRSTDFPTSQGAFQTQNKGMSSIFVTRLRTGAASIRYAYAPSPPQNVNGTARLGTLNLTWEPPASFGNVRLKGYRVYRGFRPDNLSLMMALDPSTHHLLDSPPLLGYQYCYAVSAWNFIGESNLSEPFNITVYNIPSYPLNVRITPGCESLLIKWEVPSKLGGMPVHGYHLYRGIESYTVRHYRTLGDVLQFRDENLTNGRLYSYGVVAFNSEGNSSISGVVGGVPAGSPEAPARLRAEPGDTMVTISWNKPLSDNGREVLGYRVFRGLSSDNLTSYDAVDNTVTNYEDRGLSNGVTYYYSVLAHNDMGDGPLCPAVGVMPVGLPGVPMNLVVVLEGQNANLAWDPPSFDGGMPVQGYQVYRGAHPDYCLRHVETEGTSFTDVDLEFDVTYYYRVSAFNELGDGPVSYVVSVTPRTTPSAPTGLVVTRGVDQLEISWQRPATTPGMSIFHYVLLRGEDPEHMVELVEVLASFRSYIDTDVTAGTTYHYAVVASTSHGTSPMSNVGSGFAISVPGPPVGLAAEPGDGNVTLTWAAPVDDGHSPVTKYILMRGLSEDATEKLVELRQAGRYLDTDVVNGVTYHYAVVALNAAGRGETSGTVEATPTAPYVPPVEVFPPSAPGSLTFELDGTNVLLTWTPPTSDGGSPVTGYLVLRGATADDLETVGDVGLRLVFIDEGLELETPYFYSVVAMNGEGQSEPLDAVKVVVKEEGSVEEPGFGMYVALLALLAAVFLARTRTDCRRGRP